MFIKQGRFLGLGAAAIAAVVGGVTVLGSAPAQAQPAYGSYVGLGVAVGLTGDASGRGDNFSGVIAGRYRFLETPISIRGQILVFGSTTAFVPTVSYDFPINFQTDVYIGAGVSFPSSGGTPSPVGDQTAFVIQPGIDYALPNTNLVIFGNGIAAFNAYTDGGGTAFSIQGGVGYQF
ncbi:MAG: hypothetical protein AAF728_16445 [Cyanobacteria bacterium P01_D01_bin.128]